jgi:hydrogenase small subunit
MASNITRRDLLKAFGAVGAGISVGGFPVLAGDGPAAKPGGEAPQGDIKGQVMAEAKARASDLPVVWIQGQSCSGCSVSLLNTVYPDMVELLTETINLSFHQTVMAATGDIAWQMCDHAIKNAKKGFVLVVEGSVPVGAEGRYCTLGVKDGHHMTFLDWTKKLGAAAKATIAVGACATYGGIPAGKPNPTGAKAFSEIMPEATLINIPGCPSHPDWITGTVAHVLLFGIPEMDEYKRPKMFFAQTVHDNCERRSYYEEDKLAEHHSDEGCLIALGCKGPETYCDAPIRSWNNRRNWCVQSGGPCIGCTSPSFPDHDSGLYAKLSDDRIKAIFGGPEKQVKA